MPASPFFSLLRRGLLVRNRYHLLLALGCAFVLLLYGSSQWQASASLRALGDLRLQAERVQRLDSLLIQLMDAENAVRGFLLSRNRAHLEPYTKSLTTVHQTLNAIRRDLHPGRENDETLADLSGLVAIKLHSLDQAVEFGIAGDESRTQSKHYTDRIRERILGMQGRLVTEGQVSFERSIHHVKLTSWVIVILGACALGLMATLFVFIGRQFKLREQLAQLLQNENERLDALVQERTAELSDLASYLTNAREAEKARLARELHDELGALLTAATMDADWITRQLDSAELAPCRERLARLKEMLDRGVALKRRIIDNLRPPLLEELGLVSTLRILGAEFSDADQESLSLELPDEDLVLAPAPALALFRIAQEALTNIRKHAHAGHVRIALRVSDGANDGWVELTIEDDGVGFHSAAMRGLHHGLAGMKHRVQMCAGEFAITSQPGAGTRLTARIPFAAEQPAPAVAVQEDLAWRT